MHRRKVLRGLGAALGASATGLWTPPLAWSETRAGRWMRLESPNFVMYSTEYEEKSRNEIAALERFHALSLRLMPHDVHPAPKLTVYLVGNARDFAASNPGLSSGVAGYYEAGLEQIRTVTSARAASEKQRDMPRNVRALDSRVVLFHEYVHHVSRTNMRIAYPPWYQEGFAEFLSTVEFGDGQCDIGKFTNDRAAWLTYGDWLGIEEFLGHEPWSMSPDKTAQFYAQSWLAAHYLFGQPQQNAGFSRYCVALQKGGDPLEAFEPAFGITPAAFDKELQDYKAKPINFIRISDKSPDIRSQVTVTKLDTAYDTLLMPVSHLRSLPQKDEAADSVAKIREEAKKFPSNIFARRSAALAEVWYGDLAIARTQLDGILAVDAQDPETLHLSGLCDLRAGYVASDTELIRKARKSFAAAQKLDSTRSASLFRYVECLLTEGDDVTQHMLDVLVLAFNQSPQVDVIALVTAQALMVHDRFEEAAYILQPMVGELHSRGRAQVASQLLESAKAERAEYFAFFGSAKDIED